MKPAPSYPYISRPQNLLGMGAIGLVEAYKEMRRVPPLSELGRMVGLPISYYDPITRQPFTSLESARVMKDYVPGGRRHLYPMVGTPSASDMAGMMVPGTLLGVQSATKLGKVKHLREAGILEKSGVHMDKIRARTGWFRSPYDKKWRFELDDSVMNLKQTPDEWTSLKKVINHPKLFKAYPELEDVMVRFDPTVMNSRFEEGGYITIGMVTSPRKGLAHEVQHAIQQIEGFARGGSSGEFAHGMIVEIRDRIYRMEERMNRLADRLQEAKLRGDHQKVESLSREGKRLETSYDKLLDAEAKWHPDAAYKRLAGEIEADEVASRLDLTPEERIAKKPFEKSIPPGDAIVQFGPSYSEMAPTRRAPKYYGDVKGLHRMPHYGEKPWSAVGTTRHVEEALKPKPRPRTKPKKRGIFRIFRQKPPMK